MREIKLKPCPFCGGVARYSTVKSSGEYDPMPLNEGAEYIACSKCGASTNLTFPLMDDVTEIVIEKWNRRKGEKN